MRMMSNTHTTQYVWNSKQTKKNAHTHKVFYSKHKWRWEDDDCNLSIFHSIWCGKRQENIYTYVTLNNTPAIHGNTHEIRTNIYYITQTEKREKKHTYIHTHPHTHWLTTVRFILFAMIKIYDGDTSSI